MGYTCMVVKVRARDAEAAVGQVNRHFEVKGYLESTFKFFDPDATKISEECTSEKHYKELRKKEISLYKTVLAEALARPDDHPCKGYELKMAGELLVEEMSGSRYRMCWDYTLYQDKKEGKIYYVDTTRKC